MLACLLALASARGKRRERERERGSEGTIDARRGCTHSASKIVGFTHRIGGKLCHIVGIRACIVRVGFLRAVFGRVIRKKG